ncbi:MAG: efflux RND transporter periplasmic adaptor subunit [Verrucomicrobiota bacterium]
MTSVIQRDVPIVREWVGSLDGYVNTQVRARVSGYLISQDYTEGALVHKNDLLFQIDPRPLQAALDQAKGELQRAQASEKLASANARRSSQLFGRQVISIQERETSTESAGTAVATVASARAAVETAELNVEFARIISPVDGIAGIANAQIGDLVGPTTAQLTTISTVDPIKAYVNVTEQDYIEFTRYYSDRMARRDYEKEIELEMILADGSIYPHKGKFYAADRQVDQTTGSIRFAGVFENPGSVLRPGQFCRVRAVTNIERGALLVPQRAVTELQGSYQVATVGADSKVNIRSVKVGERIGNLWIIKEGIRPGDSVVVEGLQKAREGAQVAPKPWKPEQSRP